MRSRIFLKVMVAFALVILTATVTLDIRIRSTWENSLRRNAEQSVTQNVQGFALRVLNDRQHSLQDIAAEEARVTGTRATIIAHDGTVLADSGANPQEMENHADRPEVIAALHGQNGVATRRSQTLGVEFLYAAAPSGDRVVRLAFPLSAIDSQMDEVRASLLRASGLALLVALLLALFVAQTISTRLKRIVRFAEQVARGDLAARISETSGDEIAQVAAALDRTARSLEDNFAALRESRAQLEVLLNSMNDGVIAVSPDLKALWANQAMADLVNQPIRIGTAITELLRHPDFLATLHAALHSRQREIAIVPALLGSKAFSVTAEPLPDGGVVSVLHDISEIERVEKTRRDFIANVSHELRTPLTSIRGYAETLLDSADNIDENTRDFLNIIKRNAERMSRLTEDLLVLARVESGEEKLDLHPHSSRLLVQEAAAAMQENARTTGIEITLNGVPETPVIADSYAIHQVLGNLISNALRYAQAGKQIVLGASEKAHVIEFSVKDFGPGIPSEHLPRIFERFYRVDKARSRETGGTGLGLAIVKHIVLNHGGKVRVESVVGHGATFFFTLPKA
ncbi:MAG TPA: ATP-binding protein [Candidatus Angelobacter sp.]|nr:ATP-binding protein [Candidatus Angelobacter sp.]